jgi:hypothetical protein
VVVAAAAAASSSSSSSSSSGSSSSSSSGGGGGGSGSGSGIQFLLDLSVILKHLEGKLVVLQTPQSFLSGFCIAMYTQENFK